MDLQNIYKEHITHTLAHNLDTACKVGKNTLTFKAQGLTYVSRNLPKSHLRYIHPLALIRWSLDLFTTKTSKAKWSREREWWHPKRARKAIRKTKICSLKKVWTYFQNQTRQNNCKLAWLETFSFWRYKAFSCQPKYARKVWGLSRNAPTGPNCSMAPCV